MAWTICRLCMSSADTTNIFEYTDKELPEIIQRCIAIQITRNDGLPNNICTQCIQKIKEFDVYRKQCQHSDSILKETYSELKNDNMHLNDAWNDCDNKINDSDSTDNDADYDPTYDVNELSSKNELLSVLENSSLCRKKCKLKIEIENNQNERERKIRIYKMDSSMKTIIGTNIYICDICNKEFDSFFEYHNHQIVHNGELVFKCSKCKDVFFTREDLLEHDARHKIACKICNLEVLPKSMPAHLLIHTDIHKCIYCDTRHTSNASLEKHIKARHIGIKGFVCHVCGKQSSCQSSMTRHMAYHSSDRPFKCKYCDFCAKSLNIVQVHTSRRHFAEKCVCDICAKLFKSQPSLIQHMKRIHTAKKYMCNICGKTFIERYNLNQHLKRHVDQRLHECKICHKEFFTVRKLKEHMHSHRQGCVNCPKCGKEFFYKKYFAKHVYKCIKTEDNIVIANDSCLPAILN